MTSSMRGAAVRSAAPITISFTTHPGAPLAALKGAIATLRDAGASFGELPTRYATEWAALGQHPEAEQVALHEVALTASERRLHRESEQLFRMLCVAARALCLGAQELERPLRIDHVGSADLPSLRGMMRAVEHARVMPRVEFVWHEPGRIRAPLSEAADYRLERLAYLRRLGIDLADAAHARVELAPRPATAGDDEEGLLLDSALDGKGDAADTLAAALAYSRRAFFSCNWEGMAAVADAAVPILDGHRGVNIEDVLTKATEHDDHQVDAIEFEPGILRTPADLRAFLFKVLGVQATFRGRQADASDYFRRMRERSDGLSPELRAQSHLYTALTMTKRLDQLHSAVSELEQGFDAVTGDDAPPSVRRERGWLHNLRGLTYFKQKELIAALRHEKAALACIEGLHDASSVHLRVNVLSNLSVLQEAGGRISESRKTWSRFAALAGTSNDSFVKHHAYRHGGLSLRAGERDEALAALSESLRRARLQADDFHEFELLVESAHIHATGMDSTEAASLYGQAREPARRLGDPYRILVATTGHDACRGSRPDQERAAQLASASTSHARQAATIASAVHSPLGQLLAVLPAPRTKLNRPFDLINA